MESVALVAVGSTNFRYTVSTTDGEFRSEVAVEPTRAQELEAQISRAVEMLRDRHRIDAISIVLPGLVAVDAGVVRDFDTADGALIERLDLRSGLERRFDVPVYLANDCNASALGEWHFGARGGADCLVHLTVGTGIGGGVVDRGRLLRGESGGAGEFGLLPIAHDMPLESSGVPGAWEAVCSGRGIPHYVTHRYQSYRPASRLESAITAGELTARDVFAAAAEGDAFACDCLDRIDRYNAAGFAVICNAFEPGRITVGGGVALNNFDRVRRGIAAHLEELCFVDPPAIERTPLGDDIGLYGALGVARERARYASPAEGGTSYATPESVD